MLWVRTFSVFFPSLFSSSVVWLSAGAAQKPSSAAHIRILFITTSRLNAEPAHRDSTCPGRFLANHIGGAAARIKRRPTPDKSSSRKVGGLRGTVSEERV